jgi:hypothetical protein
MTYARYGVGRYGTFDYGEGWSETASSAVEGSIAQAKDCTVFLARDNDMDDDVSQFLTDLTTSGAGGYELNSTRADLTGEPNSVRSMCAVFTWNSTRAKSTIARHGSTTSASQQTWRVDVTAGDEVHLHVDSTAVVQLDLPSVSANNIQYILCIQSFPNPDATGSSDEILTTMSIGNVTAGTIWPQYEWVHKQATHAYAAGSGYAFSVGGSWHGGTLHDPFDGTLHSFRLDNAYVSTAEYSEDFAKLPRPSGLATESSVRQEAVRPGTNAFDADEYLGQGNLGFICEAARKNDLRYAGPFVGAVFAATDGTTTVTWPAVSSHAARHKTTLGGFTYSAGYVFAMPVHRSVRRVRVRLFVNWTDDGVGALPLTLRALSSSSNPFAPPNQFGQNASAPKQYRTQATLANEHTGNTFGGEWVDLGILTLAIKPDSPSGPIEGLSSTTWISIGYKMDTATAESQTLQIRAVHIWPVINDAYTPTPGSMDTGGLAVP